MKRQYFQTVSAMAYRDMERLFTPVSKRAMPSIVEAIQNGDHLRHCIVEQHSPTNGHCDSQEQKEPIVESDTLDRSKSVAIPTLPHHHHQPTLPAIETIALTPTTPRFEQDDDSTASVSCSVSSVTTVDALDAFFGWPVGVEAASFISNFCARKSAPLTFESRSIVDLHIKEDEIQLKPRLVLDADVGDDDDEDSSSPPFSCFFNAITEFNRPEELNAGSLLQQFSVSHREFKWLKEMYHPWLQNHASKAEMCTSGRLLVQPPYDMSQACCQFITCPLPMIQDHAYFVRICLDKPVTLNTAIAAVEQALSSHYQEEEIACMFGQFAAMECLNAAGVQDGRLRIGTLLGDSTMLRDVCSTTPLHYVMKLADFSV